MKRLFPALFLLLSGCGPVLVNKRGVSTSQYAPINETRGGTVKYLATGADFLVRSRREDSYKLMYNYCSGPYRITHESVGTSGGVAMTTPAYGMPGSFTSYGGDEFRYIDFECETSTQRP